jgi:hypothetical protein
VIRLQISVTGIDMFGANVGNGDALKKASTVITPDGKFFLTVFSAEKPGTASITVSYRIIPNGDGGAIWPVSVNH